MTFTATVSSEAVTPQGSVQFVIDGAAAGAPVALAGGTASLTTSALSVATHTVQAVFTGVGAFGTSNATQSDAGLDAGSVPGLGVDAGRFPIPQVEDEGCGCRVSGTPSSGMGFALFGIAAALASLRRRRRR